MSNDRVRIMRVMIYEGPREWVEKQLERSITGTKRIPIFPSGRAGKITVRTIEDFPEILESHTNTEGEPIV